MSENAGPAQVKLRIDHDSMMDAPVYATFFDISVQPFEIRVSYGQMPSRDPALSELNDKGDRMVPKLGELILPVPIAEQLHSILSQAIAIAKTPPK